jgi:hypothetical protein
MHPTRHTSLPSHIQRRVWDSESWGRGLEGARPWSGVGEGQLLTVLTAHGPFLYVPGENQWDPNNLNHVLFIHVAGTMLQVNSVNSSALSLRSQPGQETIPLSRLRGC